MKTPSSRPARKPAGRKAVSATGTRAKITPAHPADLIVDESDPAAVKAVAQAVAKSLASQRAANRRSAVDRLDDPPPADPQTSLVERVSNAIERELSKIEIIIGGARVRAVKSRLPPRRDVLRGRAANSACTRT